MVPEIFSRHACVRSNLKRSLVKDPVRYFNFTKGGYGYQFTSSRENNLQSPNREEGDRKGFIQLRSVYTRGMGGMPAGGAPRTDELCAPFGWISTMTGLKIFFIPMDPNADE